MPATWFHQDSAQNKGHHHLVWLCILASSYFATATKITPLRGHVGGEVVFQCFKPHEKYKLLYLQRGEDFVNGYYESKSMSLYKPWPNSRVNKTQNAISLSTLNVSHAGQYTCYCESTKGLQNQTEIELIITANYSKPSIHHNCTDKKDQCLVWCSSHGGYPKNKIIWNVTTLEGPPIAMMWRNDSFKEDNNTQLFNISSMASFNCSTGKQNISCSVDGVSSVLSVCEQEGSTRYSTCQYNPSSSVCSSHYRCHYMHYMVFL
ncbi:hypothetical protein NQD34_009666 [Periophthalmus magnuspinnatus]|nr:hypothetical protein NQD34_009666 [Periophthalmus magnuspinnatus]